MDYKCTLNLFNTKFKMKANLSKLEIDILEYWKNIGLYDLMSNNSKSNLFIINDGPPYANGDIHIGHAFNKILKDIITKYNALNGHRINFIPGWDCHGLPIEINVEKKHGKAGIDISKKEFRFECRKYALEQVNLQKKSFIRLGISADWDNSYKTMTYDFESNIINTLRIVLNKGYIYIGRKPVYWCFNCKSSLAEAEIEYYDKNSSSIYVFFKFKDNLVDIKNNIIKCGVIVWTTTPWTLAFNEAVALNSNFKYCIVEYNNIGYLIDSTLVDILFKKLNFLNYKIICEFYGKDLEGKILTHPFYNKFIKIVLSDHVKNNTGTGCVHIAPAHGFDDYNVGIKYNLPIEDNINKNGYFNDKVSIFSNCYLFDVNYKIINILNKNKNLLFFENIKHRYPYCWRHKTSVIYKTTKQVFIYLQNKDFKLRVKNIIKNIKWVPKIGLDKMERMLDSRPDWCISRQRTWGVPITLFIHKKTGMFHPNIINIMYAISSYVRNFGVDFWYDTDVFKLFNVDKTLYYKIDDVLDVWFDSSVVYKYISNKYNQNKLPFDLCLEGSDQYRGWFQVSILNSFILNECIAYKDILVHGFILDKFGRKMSKSLKNIITPLEVIKTYGADVLRLWVSSVNYSVDMNVSGEILTRVSEAYRKIRNTFRFLLLNTSDFIYKKHFVEFKYMLKIDVWILFILFKLQEDIIKSYSNYNFHLVYKKIYNFCTNELGNKYFDIVKDRLYTSRVDTNIRRSVQSSLYFILNILVKLISPILSFTSEEIWMYIKDNKTKSVFLSTFLNYKTIDFKSDNFNYDFWLNLFLLKDEVNKVLEKYRKLGIIGSSLDAGIEIFCNLNWYNTLLSIKSELHFFFIVSDVNIKLLSKKNEEVEKTLINDIFIKVIKIHGKKCERCWQRLPNISENNNISICYRCVENVYGLGENRIYI